MRFLFVVVCLLTLPASLAAQSPAPTPEVQVAVTTGQGVVKRAPDRAWVTIAAESRARTPREAQKLNADAMSAVQEKLKGIVPPEAIRTLGYDLQPEFDYANNRRTLRGYVARNTVEVRADDLSKLGQLLEGAVGAGATNVSGVRFDLKDRDAAEREALKLAVADARARADAAAQGAGAKVQRVLRIEEQDVSPGPQPRMAMMREAMQTTAGGEPPIAAGEIEIRVTVTLTVAIR